jgi:hypothetical protein
MTLHPIRPTSPRFRRSRRLEPGRRSTYQPKNLFRQTEPPQRSLGTDVDHRTSQYKNNVLEQDHQGIKGRYRSMRGFKNFDAAHRFCRAFDEVRNFLRPTSYINQNVSLARRRVIHVQRVAALRDLISAI